MERIIDNTNYIIEEKYRIGKKIIYKPFDNHLIQVLAYIYGLTDIKAKRGYILYWKPALFNLRNDLKEDYYGLRLSKTEFNERIKITENRIKNELFHVFKVINLNYSQIVEKNIKKT